MPKLQQSLILIYGNNPQLNRVERSLRAASDLRVIQIDPDDSTASEQLAVLREAVLIYDAGSTDPALIQAIRTLHRGMTTMALNGTNGHDNSFTVTDYPPSLSETTTQILASLRGRHLSLRLDPPVVSP